jgi:hypothetical protein
VADGGRLLGYLNGQQLATGEGPCAGVQHAVDAHPRISIMFGVEAAAAQAAQPGGQAAQAFGGEHLGVHARTAKQHREDASRGGERAVELGKAFGGEHGADTSATGSRGNEAMAKAKGLQGGEECPGCDGEKCAVFKKGLGGKGSDGKKGYMIGWLRHWGLGLGGLLPGFCLASACGQWYCGRQGGCLYKRARREGGFS